MTDRMQSVGTLFVIATPIGNLGDLSARARETLAAVDTIAAEDTRRTGVLLQKFGVDKRVVSLHEHNEGARVNALIAQLRSGLSIGLVSDAGTPLISDPGYALVAAAIENEIPIVPVPGPSAVIAALSISGLPTDRFAFEGFLPARTQQRRDRLAELASDTRTLVFYEAPHRLSGMLADLEATLGNRRAVVARELTKQFESVYRGTTSDLARKAEQDRDMQRGEIVVVVAGNHEVQSPAELDAEHILRELLAELPPASAAKIAARLTGRKRDELYRRAIALNPKPD